jgi:hypothetical protein
MVRALFISLGRGQNAQWRKTEKWELGNELGIIVIRL